MTYYLRSGGNRWDIRTKDKLSFQQIIEKYGQRLKKNPPESLGLLTEIRGGHYSTPGYFSTELALRKHQMWKDV